MKNVKNIFEIIIFIVIIGLIIYKGIVRFEKIENGDIVLVNQNQMDR